jgi:hypothetical protein
MEVGRLRYPRIERKVDYANVPVQTESRFTDAYNGDIRRRQEVSERLAHDVRQGVHARKVMESYQTWFRKGPELSCSPHVRSV